MVLNTDLLIQLGLEKQKMKSRSKGIEIAKSKVSKASVLIYMFDILDTTVEEILKDLNELYSKGS